MCFLRQMVETRLGVQAIGFFDLEKPFDTVPNEMVMATLRWMGLPDVRMVEGMSEKTTARVMSGEGNIARVTMTDRRRMVG